MSESARRDDTAYLQSFLDAGQVPPPGEYRIRSPLLNGAPIGLPIAEGGTGRLPDAIDTRPHARHIIDDALADWRDQSDEDMPSWMYNPDTVKELARFIRDRLETAGMLAPRP